MLPDKSPQLAHIIDITRLFVHRATHPNLQGVVMAMIVLIAALPENFPVLLLGPILSEDPVSPVEVLSPANGHYHMRRHHLSPLGLRHSAGMGRSREGSEI